MRSEQQEIKDVRKGSGVSRTTRATQKKKKRKKTRRHRSSMVKWAHHFSAKRKHMDALAAKFESVYPKLANPDISAPPVNILCLDGGGMKGYALPIILRAINDKYNESEKSDILQQFDLIAGTSVGGAFAIASSLMKSLEESCDEFTDDTDDIRERTFSNMKLKNLIKTGASVPLKNQIEAICKSRWGDTPLLDPGGPKAMALAASVGNNDAKWHNSMDACEPIVLRTYEYPPADNRNSKFETDYCLVESIASLTAAEAMAATTALPFVVHCMKTIKNGRTVSLADGGLYGNCPIPVAIDEARRLYPRRPVGVVMSIGFSNSEDDFLERIVEAAKLVNPDFHFHRLAPSHITGDFKMNETSLERVVQMEQEVHDYILEVIKISSTLDETMDKLYRRQVRRPNSPALEFGSPEYLRREVMLQNVNFLQRLSSRHSLKENSASKMTNAAAAIGGACSPVIRSLDEELMDTINFDDDNGVKGDHNTDKSAEAKICGGRLWDKCSPCFAPWRGSTILHNGEDDMKLNVKVKIEAMSMMDREGTTNAALPLTNSGDKDDTRVENVSDSISENSSSIAVPSFLDDGVNFDGAISNTNRSCLSLNTSEEDNDDFNSTKRCSSEFVASCDEDSRLSFYSKLDTSVPQSSWV